MNASCSKVEARSELKRLATAPPELMDVPALRLALEVAVAVGLPAFLVRAARANMEDAEAIQAHLTPGTSGSGPLSTEESLLEAVTRIRDQLGMPATKQVHAALILEEQWSQISLSDVKRACSKAAKQGLVSAQAPQAGASAEDPCAGPELAVDLIGKLQQQLNDGFMLLDQLGADGGSFTMMPTGKLDKLREKCERLHSIAFTGASDEQYATLLLRKEELPLWSEESLLDGTWTFQSIGGTERYQCPDHLILKNVWTYDAATKEQAEHCGEGKLVSFADVRYIFSSSDAARSHLRDNLLELSESMERLEEGTRLENQCDQSIVQCMRHVGFDTKVFQRAYDIAELLQRAGKRPPAGDAANLAVIVCSLFTIGRVIVKAFLSYNIVLSDPSRLDGIYKHIYELGRIARHRALCCGTPATVTLPTASTMGLHVERGMHNVDVASLRKSICAVCEKHTNQKCGGCEMVGYCCNAHQQEHWTTHKKTCKMMTVKCALCMEDLDKAGAVVDALNCITMPCKHRICESCRNMVVVEELRLTQVVTQCRHCNTSNADNAFNDAFWRLNRLTHLARSASSSVLHGQKLVDAFAQLSLVDQLADTLSTLEGFADSGDTRAALIVGCLHEEGAFGFDANPAEAARYYERARGSEQFHNTGAPAKLARLFELGHGVSRDIVRAAKLYEEAARLGCRNSMNSTGFMYFKGLGVQKNAALAFKWFSAALAHGDVTAGANLGGLLASGDFIESSTEAIQLLLRAAEDSNNPSRGWAAFSLSSCYETGRGVTCDKRAAMRWLERSVDAGCPDAENVLGLHFAEGTHGLPKDRRKAIKLWRLAASKGHNIARVNLDHISGKTS